MYRLPKASNNEKEQKKAYQTNDKLLSDTEVFFIYKWRSEHLPVEFHRDRAFHQS
jgi:hypothetical protein